MTRADNDLNRLFHDMANQSAAPEAAAAQSLRRQRAIGGMRALHRRLADEHGRTRQRRRYWGLGLIAATVALCGSALAGAGGFLHVSAKEPTTPARVTSTPRAERAPHRDSQPTVANAVVPSAPAPEAKVPAPNNALAPSRSVPSSTPAKTQTADLEQVNRIFAEAKRARREHRDADALALVQQLLTEHPGSVLTHEASVERFRALARLGRTAEARRYANSYLARYPNGFAAEEARRIAGGETP